MRGQFQSGHLRHFDVSNDQADLAGASAENVQCFTTVVRFEGINTSLSQYAHSQAEKLRLIIDHQDGWRGSAGLGVHAVSTLLPLRHLYVPHFFNTNTHTHRS